MNFTAGILATTTEDPVDALLREAIGAPRGVASSGAWALRATGAMIELLADPGPNIDPWQRTVLLDGGAGLLNLKVLIRGMGVQPAVRLYPDPARRDLVATIRLEGQHLVTEQDRALVAAVVSGAPSQPAETTAADTGPLVTALRRAAKTEQAWLAVQPMSALPTAGRAPLPNGDADHQGGTALIIGTILDGPGPWLQAGQAAQRVALVAATQHVSVSATAPDLLEAQTHRQAVRELIGGGLWPQAVLHVDRELQQPRPHGVELATSPTEPATA